MAYCISIKQKLEWLEYMIDKDAQKAANRFMEKLTRKGFTMSRSKNAAENYDKVKQQRDSKAVVEFTKTNLFKDIMALK